MPITIKTDEITQEAYQREFQKAKEENPLLTNGVFFSKLIEHYINSSTSNQQRESASDGLILEIAELLDVPADKILEEIKATQQRAMMVPETVEVPEALAENEIRFEIPEPHLSLLQETKNRLSAKYGSGITIKDILLDMFARYTIEMYNQWFYPFVIRPDEFKEITGYTQNDLKAWLRKTDQA
ncbi:MAG: hypothetical protein VB046_06800 [Paludibacter sp.]|nr:hypothetical protein [Paludibacter sp.]